MGYYSTLIRCDDIKTTLSKEEFMRKWIETVRETEGTDKEGYLFYNWELSKEENGFRWFSIEMDEWFAKHYADRELAEFISEVISDDAKCILEFNGEDGVSWGYYITKNSVKEIEYVKLVDGKVLED